MQVQLIEEGDQGFYIVGPKESKAIFVPRSSVALICFSDKAADFAYAAGQQVNRHENQPDLINSFPFWAT